ncbi:hypothetical protein Cst_c16100 [Thermoclostridium stercorarium subsp. stercorarium DSM 8532]|uniref:Uncharacterized protein n=1 Tax=Thermoclostridium stercorarium (strain ATCC 35414 / DSM 8532 / NCIMB 11754) TaxID=1121335 RepID=L7VQ98_THES1|nr:hypothetical protein Cst_c16100 [Thermoclostridium stercorarium subsp. stercorarium DSM 8532]
MFYKTGFRKFLILNGALLWHIPGMNILLPLVCRHIPAMEKVFKKTCHAVDLCIGIVS